MFVKLLKLCARVQIVLSEALDAVAIFFSFFLALCGLTHDADLACGNSAQRQLIGLEAGPSGTAEGGCLFSMRTRGVVQRHDTPQRRDS